jgi:predicted transcriptional regulator
MGWDDLGCFRPFNVRIWYASTSSLENIITHDNVTCHCKLCPRLINCVSRWQTLFKHPPGTPNFSRS